MSLIAQAAAERRLTYALERIEELRRDLVEMTHQRDAHKAAADKAELVLRAIHTSATAMGGEGLVYVTPEQYEALSALLEGHTND